MVTASLTNGDWVLLSYHVPREPSTPRIAIWRKLKELGVAQLGDGLVALPRNARTLEHLEWIAEQVLEADGRAVVWTAAPTLKRDTAELVAQLNDARTAEYAALEDQVAAAGTRPDRRTIAKWRRALRSIQKRDYFDASGSQSCHNAIEEFGRSIPEPAAAGGGAS